MDQVQLNQWLRQLCESTELDLKVTGEGQSDFLATIDDLNLAYKVDGQILRLKRRIEMLDVDSLQLNLAQRNLTVDCQYQLVTQSTNLDVLAFYERTQKTSIAICEMQTSGKGRRGNHWVSPFGRNIYCTVGVLKSIKPTHLGLLSILTGLALCRSLTQLGYQGVQLKWPNDLYFQNKKLGGILIESRPATKDQSSDDQYFLAIGFGINVDMSVDELESIEQAATCLNMIGNKAVSRNQIILESASQVLNDIQAFSAGDIPHLVEAFDAIDALRGMPVNVLSSGQTIAATNAGIAPTGQLRVKTEQGIELFSAADISLRRA